MSEFLDIVNEKDRIIGKATRDNVHESRSWHRGTHIFLINSRGELLLPLRSPNKDKFPNVYDCSVSEHVRSGESYKAAALRGLKEELGVTASEIKSLVKFTLHYGPQDNMISTLFEFRYDGKLEFDKEEISGASFVELGRVKEMLRDEYKFAPWTLELLKWYFHMPSKITELPP